MNTDDEDRDICPSSPEAESAPIAPLEGDSEAGRRASDSRAEDRELVGSILDDRPGAFDRLFARDAGKVYAFAVRRLHDPVEAEDVVQDTFFEVHRSLASWEGRSRLLSWIFGIAHHQLCRRFRKKTPIALPIEALETSAPMAPSANADDRVDAARALALCVRVLDDEVSSGQREIFELYYGQNRAMKEIARDLGKSKQAIKISLFRTRRVMDARLDACGFRRAG